MMALLHDVEVPTAAYHLRRLFKDSELVKEQVIRNFLITAKDGKNVTAQPTKRFFATVQNKLHWAIDGQTAAELIYTRADARKEHMGLSTWKDASRGKILMANAAFPLPWPASVGRAAGSGACRPQCQ